MTDKPKNQAAVALGRLGGLRNTAKQKSARLANISKSKGRPRLKDHEVHPESLRRRARREAERKPNYVPSTTSNV